MSAEGAESVCRVVNFPQHTYLAQELTVITKAVLPGRGPLIALRLG